MYQTRAFDAQRVQGMVLPCSAVAVAAVIHLAFVFIVWGPRLWSDPAIAYVAGVVLLVYHFVFSSLCLSFYNCIMTDPGEVPPNWGLRIGDDFTRKRRYCKTCRVCKPERTYHCSFCNRCVLGMNHHNPWINNCVGFYNRKFFIQFLCYLHITWSIVTLLFMPEVLYRVSLLTMSQVHVVSVETTAKAPVSVFCLGPLVLSTILLWCFFVWSLVCLFLLPRVIKLQVTLVLQNYTLVEHFQREEGATSRFDIGARGNWEQVFGAAPWLWWLPVHTRASRPVGDGVRWRLDSARAMEEELEELASWG